MEVMLGDNTKRMLCRAGFLLLCAIPTLLCVRATIFPKSVNHWSAEIQHQFGVINRIGHVQLRSPNQTEFHDLRIGSDRFQSRLNIDKASLWVRSDAKTLVIENARGSVSAFWNTMNRIVESVAWSGNSDRDVCLQFETMTFLDNEHQSGAAFTWNDLRISISKQGQHLVATFVCDQHTDRFMENESVVRLERTVTEQGINWSIVAVGYRIPCWVLKHVIPAAASLNSSAEFADVEANLVCQNELWSGGLLSGRLMDADLDQLVARRFGRVLTGRVLVNVHSLQIRNNRIESMDGDLYSQSGVIGSSLLNAFTHSLGMQLVEPFDQSTGNENYTDLRFGFRINRDQIAIYGMESGAVLNDATGHSILIAQHGQNHPVSSLLNLVSWPAARINANAAALSRYLVVSPIDDYRYEALPRTSKHEQAGSETFFNR